MSRMVRTPSRFALLAILLIALLLLLADCGSSGSAPTAVGGDDLHQNGDFWNELTPDLKIELVEFAKSKLAGERPEGASEIEADRNQPLIAEIDRQFTNQTKREATIYDTYVQSGDHLAEEKFRELVPQLEAGP